MMRYYGFGWGDGLWAICGLLLFIALIVVLVWAISGFGRGHRADHLDRGTPRDPSRPSAQDILRERFARGEITEEQFEQAKKVLDRNP